MSNAPYVAAQVERLREAGGIRTSVDLTAPALDALATLRQAWGCRSNSETICTALAMACNQRAAADTMRDITALAGASRPV